MKPAGIWLKFFKDLHNVNGIKTRKLRVTYSDASIVTFLIIETSFVGIVFYASNFTIASSAVRIDF